MEERYTDTEESDVYQNTEQQENNVVMIRNHTALLYEETAGTRFINRYPYHCCPSVCALFP